MTPDEKDLERAEKIRQHFPITLTGSPADAILFDRLIAEALREERQRLLNDPRIKGVKKALEEIDGGVDYYEEPHEAQFIARKALKDFESLLKENEQGKP